MQVRQAVAAALADPGKEPDLAERQAAVVAEVQPVEQPEVQLVVQPVEQPEVQLVVQLVELPEVQPVVQPVELVQELVQAEQHSLPEGCCSVLLP